MIIIDTNELKGLTQQAIDDGRREAERIAREQAEAQERQRRQDRVKADGIIAQIPGRACTAAKAQQSYAVVMSLRDRTDFNRPAGDEQWGFCSEYWLTGAAVLVWDACRASRLQPELQYWYEDSGDSGFNIVIHWTDPQKPDLAGAYELYQLTWQAIEEGRRDAERIAHEKAEAEERERQAEQVLANSIIAQIPERARAAARAKQSYAIVMGLRSGTDYREPLGNRNHATLSEHWLTGAARLVWDACVNSKLKPELQYWHDGFGVNSGFNIVIHW